MICLDGEKGKGSCRSCGGFNLFEALNECGEYLEGFGGHALAAGLTIKKENIDAFRAAIGDYYRAHPTESVATLDIDLCIDAPELLDMACVEDLEQLEPCGTGNPRPQLALLGARITELTPIGGGKHLRARLEKFGQSYEAVYFSHTVESLGLRVGDWADAAFYPQINEFRGRRSVQLLLIAIRPHDSTAVSAILAGEIGDELADFLPVRDSFARLWRALSAKGGRFTGTVSRFCDSLCPTLREETLCICLKVLEELELVTLETEGGALTVTCGSGKADLDASGLLRRLREAKRVRDAERACIHTA